MGSTREAQEDASLQKSVAAGRTRSENNAANTAKQVKGIENETEFETTIAF